MYFILILRPKPYIEIIRFQLFNVLNSYKTIRRPTVNTGLAKVAVQCSAETFVVNQSLVLRINICGENRHLRQARNRYLTLLLQCPESQRLFVNFGVEFTVAVNINGGINGAFKGLVFG